MRLTAPIREVSRLLPPPRRTPAAPTDTPQPICPRARVARPEVWTLSRETAAAAFAAQMLAVSRRGLKADAAERARYVRTYAGLRKLPLGLFMEQDA